LSVKSQLVLTHYKQFNAKITPKLQLRYERGQKQKITLTDYVIIMTSYHPSKMGAKMNWFEKHLNWTYGIALIIGLIALIIVGFINNNVIGYIVYIAIIIIGGALVSWRKGRFLAYPILILFPPAFAIVILCLHNKRKETKELKTLEPFQFQNWVLGRIGGHSSTKKSSDMGIDGYTFMTREPILIKQSEGVGQNIVDNFETAIRRQHKKKGYIIAFSFAKGAYYEEAARVKIEGKDSLDIILVRVDEIDKYFPIQPRL